jgi:hypothetical protein
MSLTYYRIKHPKFDDLNIFICELETEINDSIIQKSINYLQNYIIRKQYVEHENIAMYVSYIKHNTKTTKPVFTANNQEVFDKYYNKLGNFVIREAIQNTKETEIFMQNLDRMSSIMVASSINDDNLVAKKYIKHYLIN